MLFGGGANMWVTMSPRSSWLTSLDSGDAVWPIWIISGRLNDVATSWARRNTSTSSTATPLVNRALTPTTTSRLRAMAAFAASTSARLRSIVSPPGRIPARPMLMRTRPRLRRPFCDRNHLVDLVRALRSRIDPAGHAVGQAHCRPRFLSGIVRVTSRSPGTTTFPVASITSAVLAAMSASTAAIRLPVIATSRMALTRSEGSTTRPPLRIRS